jgi:GH15 family glucan-1,4-alpha-glucosidase
LRSKSRSKEDRVPYPPIAQLGVIGDRRTAAVVGTDGTVHWLCLPNHDGIPIFVCLLDSSRGGYWRLGPANVGAGRPSYFADSNVLVTRWSTAAGELELTEAMLFPAGTRLVNEERRRRMLRRLRCRHGSTLCIMELAPRYDFKSVAELTTAIDDYIKHNNAQPKPFTWTKSAHDIILKVNRGRAALGRPPLLRNS